MDQPEASPRLQKQSSLEDEQTVPQGEVVQETIEKTLKVETEVTPITRNLPPIPQKRNFIPKTIEDDKLDSNVFDNDRDSKKTYYSPIPPLKQPITPPLLFDKKQGSWWRKDEKSSGSVKDKIARFSSSSTTTGNKQENEPNKKLTKTYKSSEDILNDILSIKTVAPNENKIITINENCENIIKTNENIFAKTRSSSNLDLSLTLDKIDVPTTKVPRTPLQKTNLDEGLLGFTKTRSQSMCNISSQFEMNSIITTMNVRNKESAESRKLALNSLIEQRRRSMSKLKGLVIPEKATEVTDLAVVDLPEIRSTNTDLPKINKDEQNPREFNTSPTNKTYSSKSLLSPPWKDCDSNLMKYSPAFKRKNLQLYGISPQNTLPDSIPNETNYCKDEVLLKDNEDSLSPSVTSPINSSFTAFNLDTTDGNTFISIQDEIITSRKVEKYDNESDNDSAVGSSQSSCSKDISLSSIVSEPTSRREEIYTKPSLALEILEDQLEKAEEPIQPTVTPKFPPKIEDNLIKQTQCSANEINQEPIVESINRKNVLKSAKQRNGQELNFSSIRSKFENDDHSIPTPKNSYNQYKIKKETLNLSNNNNDSLDQSSDEDILKKHENGTLTTTKRSRICVPNQLKNTNLTNNNNSLPARPSVNKITDNSSAITNNQETIVNGTSKYRKKSSDRHDKANEKSVHLENDKPSVNGMPQLVSHSF